MSPLPLLLALLVAEAYAGCSVDVNKSPMPKPQPLLLKPGGSKDVHGFVTPDSKGVISLNQDEQIIVACPDSALAVTGQQQATASCVSGTTFSINGQPYNFVDLKCNLQPWASAQRTGSSCGSSCQYKVINLGFLVGCDFYTLIEACFDDHLYRTVYDHFTLVAQIGGRQTGFKWGKWFDGGLFPNLDINGKYNPNTEVTTFEKLLGSSSSASRYITKTNYLSRGHLSANSDFMLGAQQVATYSYVNAAPQWQKFNSGNWQIMETNVQTYAKTKSVNLEIYTGTHGITTLPNVNNIETELYLYADGSKYIPVPKIFWKIVYNANTKAAVVFVGVNNPYIKQPGSDYLVCTDVCSQIDWLTWDPSIKVRGISYCCEYADFKKTVANAPDLSVTSLLI